jgi:hypothetical protein
MNDIIKMEDLEFKTNIMSVTELELLEESKNLKTKCYRSTEKYQHSVFCRVRIRGRSKFYTGNIFKFFLSYVTDSKNIIERLNINSYLKQCILLNIQKIQEIEHFIIKIKYIPYNYVIKKIEPLPYNKYLFDLMYPCKHYNINENLFNYITEELKIKNRIIL